MAISEWVSGRVFRFVHGNNLVYNTCWEDPRLDRQALELTAQDRLLVITSAGCNALDYLLCGVGHVYAIDMNPRQNALLELKVSAIRHLDYEQLFAMFGQGRLPGAEAIYASKLRQSLSSSSRKYWDRWIRFFDHPKKSFYFRGTSGAFAHMIGSYVRKVARCKKEIMELLDSPTLAAQQSLYPQLKEKIWSKTLRFAMNRDSTLSLLGVPKAQRRQIDEQYPGGIVKFIEDSLDAVFSQIPLQDNYFWRVYITGSYTTQCCPEYLKPDNHEKLRDGCLDRLTIQTDSVEGFLRRHNGQISRFVLLDHMDWLSDHYFPLLESEWQAIIDRAAPKTRILWRSGGLRTDFLNDVTVKQQGKTCVLPELLTFQSELSNRLHQLDRVHTYGSFYIADVNHESS
jgi:S-adenosylmethionine-diacylglycerol 3-amino-3-carboxypropyl transferase